MTEQQDNKAKKPRLNLTTSQVAASALAACCASIVASYLGVAGTVIGAAVGSVVATTGAAIYGHLFRTGGDKIKQTLLVNGQEVEVEVDRDDPVNEAAIPTGRFYGAQANAATQTADLWHPKTPTGETQVITEESEEPGETKAEKTRPEASSIGSRIVRIKKYRKSMSIAAAIIAVFCISIVVGVIAGAPVRSAGSNSSPATVTTTTTVTDTGHTQGRASDGSSASSSSSASPSSDGTSSETAPSSGSATSSSSAGSTTSPSASPSTGAASTGQALSGATSTGSPTS